MLAGPYDDTNAKGKYSGREFNTEKADWPVKNLDWSGAVIDSTGLIK